MHHQVCGIQVAANDVEDILKSVRNEKAAKDLARELLKSLPPPDAWRITAEMIAVECSWTGNDRELCNKHFQNVKAEEFIERIHGGILLLQVFIFSEPARIR